MQIEKNITLRATSREHIKPRVEKYANDEDINSVSDKIKHRYNT